MTMKKKTRKSCIFKVVFIWEKAVVPHFLDLQYILCVLGLYSPSKNTKRS